jgi:hypothetical protein
MKKILFLFLTFLIADKLMPQTTTPKTATENLPTIVILDGFANAFNAHDVDRILSYMTEDCVFEASAGPDVDGEKFAGREAVKKAFEDVFKIYPDDIGAMSGISSQVKCSFRMDIYRNKTGWQ